MNKDRLVVFTCNWNAYHGLETAGKKGMGYDSRIIPIRLACLGRISTGIVLKAFEQGALGVLLLGCPEDECRYHVGFSHARQVQAEAREILALLGYSKERLKLDRVEAGAGMVFCRQVDDFLKGLLELKGPGKIAV